MNVKYIANKILFFFYDKIIINDYKHNNVVLNFNQRVPMHIPAHIVVCERIPIIQMHFKILKKVTFCGRKTTLIES